MNASWIGCNAIAGRVDRPIGLVRAAKVALQKAGINPTPARLIVQVSGEGPLEGPGSRAGASSGAGEPAPTTDRVQANLRQDTEAANIASAQLPEDQENEISRARSVASEGISEEGRNLIGETDGQG